MKKTMQCMIRMDDITADMDWERFERICEIFKKYDVFPLLGVVPDNHDVKLSIQEKKADFWEIICSLQDKGWMIAQHGTFHQYVTSDSGILGIKDASEFAGLSYEEQYRKINTGKKILEANGIYSNVFMAPGHTYDVNTIKALKQLGFCAVTDGLYSKPYYDEGILFVPCRMENYHNIKGIDTICLHANHMSDEDINSLEAFCKKNHPYIKPFDISGLAENAVKRNLYVRVYEKLILKNRKFKNKIANSKRLKWYMQYTYDKNSKKKWVKRIYCLPLLIFEREK